jgi:hypothetical protein
MERSYDFTLPQEYQLAGQSKHELSYSIRNAQERHWISPYNCISEQTFDGRYGYLYYYEFWMEEEETIPCIRHWATYILPIVYKATRQFDSIIIPKIL